MTKGERRGRDWGPDDLTGGPLDEVFARLRRLIPQLVVERLEVSHPGDDDNVYFIGDTAGLDRVQLDTRPGGQPPFLIESDHRDHSARPAETADIIRTHLTLDPPTRSAMQNDLEEPGEAAERPLDERWANDGQRCRFSRR